MRGRIPSYGLDLATAQPGQILESPHEVTIDDSWRIQWQSAFPATSKLTTSLEFANSCGFDEVAIPTAMLLNMTLCFSVEPFSQSCRLHLGLENARQEKPVTSGDTLRSFTRIDSLRNTSKNDASVIFSTHILVNQSGDRVFSLNKRSYYDPIPAPVERAPAEENLHLQQYFEGAQGSMVDAFRKIDSFPTSQIEPLSKGELILHPMVRPLGWTENLALSTLYRNTHPIHWDSQRYGREGIVVCGGFVQSLAFASADRELRQILDEVLVHSSHINTVAPEDRIGAMSRIIDIEKMDENLEAVTVKTLGLKNVDTCSELQNIEIPEALFSAEDLKPSAIEALCSEQCPVLSQRIALQATRVLLRPA